MSSRFGGRDPTADHFICWAIWVGRHGVTIGKGLSPCRMNAWNFRGLRSERTALSVSHPFAWPRLVGALPQDQSWQDLEEQEDVPSPIMGTKSPFSDAEPSRRPPRTDRRRGLIKKVKERSRAAVAWHC